MPVLATRQRVEHKLRPPSPVAPTHVHTTTYIHTPAPIEPNICSIYFPSNLAISERDPEDLQALRYDSILLRLSVLFTVWCGTAAVIFPSFFTQMGLEPISQNFSFLLLLEKIRCYCLTSDIHFPCGFWVLLHNELIEWMEM